MKKVLMVVVLFFVANIVSAGWLSDDTFVGFWKQYSGERINNNGSSVFGLSKNNPRSRKYIEIKKSGDLYTGTYYLVRSASSREVFGYDKADFTGSLKGDELFLDFGVGKIAPIIKSKSSGKIIEIKDHKKKYKTIGNFEKISKNKALRNINSKK